MTLPVGHSNVPVTPDEAWAGVLAGRTVRVVVGPDPEDPICLHYLDRCYEDYDNLLIYTEAVGGWSEGIKEAICEPDSSFYVEFLADPPPFRITISDEDPPQREFNRAVYAGGEPNDA